mmetsp:Transcript_16245/g.13856  ORF Transcript_16245/g.13856 Transcript_16245/m.13856 type:complete len:109 (+) Transcript_16245:276-602(+)
MGLFFDAEGNPNGSKFVLNVFENYMPGIPSVVVLGENRIGVFWPEITDENEAVTHIQRIEINKEGNIIAERNCFEQLDYEMTDQIKVTQTSNEFYILTWNGFENGLAV